jgi:phosphatidylglycerol lysyltransferase
MADRHEAAHSPAWTRWATPLVAVVLFAIAAFVISDELRHVSLHEVEAAARAVAPMAFLYALAGLAVSLAAASTFDGFALSALGRAAPWRQTRLTSTLAFALSNAGGLGLIGAAGARYRTYQGLSLSGADVALTGLIGGLTLVAIGAAGSLAQMTGAAHLGRGVGIVLALFGIKGLAVYVMAPRIGFLEHFIPERKARIGQILASSLEWTAAALILFSFLPPETRGPAASAPSTPSCWRSSAPGSGRPRWPAPWCCIA